MAAATNSTQQPEQMQGAPLGVEQADHSSRQQQHGGAGNTDIILGDLLQPLLGLSTSSSHQCRQQYAQACSRVLGHAAAHATQHTAGGQEPLQLSAPRQDQDGQVEQVACLGGTLQQLLLALQALVADRVPGVRLAAQAALLLAAGK